MATSHQKLRYLALCNFILACLAILLQLGVLIPLHQWIDWICIGFWGGVLLFLAGGAALQKRRQTVFFAVLAMMSGLAMIGFYSWGVSDVDCRDFVGNGTRKSFVDIDKDFLDYDDDLCDWRLASDILFIILGFLVLLVNMGVAWTVSTLNDPDAQTHHAPPPPPGVSATQANYPQNVQPPTTYIITNPNPASTGYPVTYPPQQHYSTNPTAYPQAPSYPSNQPYPLQGASVYEQPPAYNPDYQQKH